MSRARLKWILVFLLSILLPVSLLTWRSVQSLRDERESVLAEQRLMATLLQDVFERTVNSVTEAITYADPRSVDLQAYESSPEVDQAFMVDAEGRLLYPLVLPILFAERDPAFGAALEQGEISEFREKNYRAAMAAYREAWQKARSEREEAEALNALGRCALRVGDLETARDIHRTLTFYSRTFDADGGHPATLSYLRLAEHLGPVQGLVVLAAWAQGVLDGQYPLYPGCRQAVLKARELASQWSGEDQAHRLLLADLERIERQVEFAEDFSGILKRQRRRETGYISGVLANGESFLIYVRPLESGATIGLLFDLDQLQETMVRSQAGTRLRERGFAFALFDASRAAAFSEQVRKTLYTIVPASQWLADLRLGIYAVDADSAMAYYRKRNLGIISGILLLVGFVALGGYVLLRDTSRELRLARLRSEFVSNVSHELRTPLAAIRMNAETLLAGRYRSPEKRDEFLRTVIRESERLARLVDNILTFSQLENGRKTYDFQDCDLAEIARTTLESFDPLLQKRGFQLEVEISPSLPIVRADREALATAMANLLSNAMKYSPEQREIRLAIGERGDEIVVEVADRGIGVPPSERERIFEKFYRAANASAGAATGAGVGLALTKSIAEAHGGRIELEPRAGGGSLFRLILPRARS